MYAQRSIIPTLEAKARGSEVERNTQTPQQVGSQAGLQETLFNQLKGFGTCFLFCCHTAIFSECLLLFIPAFGVTDVLLIQIVSVYVTQTKLRVWDSPLR